MLAIGFDVSGLQAMVATHLHIDHVERILWLLPVVLPDACSLSLSRDWQVENVLGQTQVECELTRWREVV